MKKKDNSVLVVAAHPDDEVLGCGGTIYKLTKKGTIVNIIFLSNGVDSRTIKNKKLIKKKIDTRKLNAKKAAKILGANSPIFLDLPDNQLDKFPLLILVKKIEFFIKKLSPKTVYTHWGGDLNIDHQYAHNSVITACRPLKKCSVKNIFFFEIPSSTEWQIPHKKKFFFSPNWFEDISATENKKLRALKVYSSELKKWPHSRSLKGVKILAAWRGASAGVKSAEAFVLGRKII